MIQKSTSFLFALLLVSAGTGSTAFAEESEEIEELDAQEAYERGAKLFEKGEYESAAKYFQRAVDAKPHPILYYNLSQTKVKLGEWEEAKRLAKKAREGEKLDEKTTAVNDATLAGIRVVSGARAFEPGSAAPPTDASGGEPTDEGPSGGFSAFGWSGVGGVVGGAGMIVGSALIDQSLNADFRNRREARENGDLSRARNLGDTIQRKQTTGKILFFGGIGVAAVGTGLLVYDLVQTKPFGRRSGLRLGVHLYDRGGGLSIRYGSP